MSPRSAVFRCDGGVKVGAGHLARCLTLANRLTVDGWTCLFLVNSDAVKVFPRLYESAHEVRILGDEALLSAKAVTGHRGDLLVIDHYQLGADFEALARNAFTLVMAIEDYSDRMHSCDLLLNQNDGSTSNLASYGKVTRLLTGRQYALLEPTYAELREVCLERRREATKVQRLLISFGASDPNDFCGRVAATILESGLEIAIDIVVSAASPNASSLRILQDQADGDVRLHFDAENMPELMSEADLSIGAAGATTWERCCLGLPTVVYKIAENQAQIARVIADHDAGVFMGEGSAMDLVALQRAVEGFCSNPGHHRRMVENAARLTDGLGGERVVQEVEALYKDVTGQARLS